MSDLCEEEKPVRTSLSALILAGGKSSRMGQDKALVEIHGTPMLRQVCSVAQAVLSERIYIVTAWPERYQAIVPEACQFIQEVAAQGPLAGFAQGLVHVQTEWVLLLACDLPKLDATTLRSWAEDLKNISPAVMALVSREETQKGWEPLCAFYRQTSLDSLQQFLSRGGRSFQAWLSQITVQELPWTEEMLFNCNTPEDVARLEQEPL